MDATFATDNYQAGLLIGQWAKAKFEKDGKQAKIALLDLNANQVSVDVQRDQGFLEGFGIDVGDKTQIGDESDPRIVGHDVTDGAEDGGRTAMENLLQKDPSINLVYTINEPAAAGAYQALKAAGKEKDVTIVSVDGGCPGVDNVKAGVIGATSHAVPAEDGLAGRRGGRRRSPRTAPSRRPPRARTSRHRRHADHRPAADRRRVQGLGLGHGELLGLIPHPTDRAGASATRSATRPRRAQHEECRMATTTGRRRRHRTDPEPTASTSATRVARLRSSTSCTRNPTLGPLAVLVLAIIAFSILNARFLSAANLSLVLAQVTVIAVLALGQTLIILTAGIDLSVGAIAVFSSILMANFATDAGHARRRSRCCSASCCGTAMGALNGLLVTRLKLPPFIVTLGTLSIFFSLNSVVSKSETVRGSDMPELMTWTGNTIRDRRLPAHLRLDHHAAAVRGLLLLAEPDGVGQARLRHRRRHRGGPAGRHPDRPGAAVGLHRGRRCSTRSAPGS